MAANETPSLFSSAGFSAARIQPVNYDPVDGDWAFVIGSDLTGRYDVIEVGDTAGVSQEVYMTAVTLIDFAIRLRQTKGSKPAQRRGREAYYPTGYSGGETFVIAIDGGSNQTFTFQATDQELSEVVDRINATIVDGVAVADNEQLRIDSNTSGSSSSVQVVGGTGLTELGHTTGTTNGEEVTFKLVCTVDGSEYFSIQPDEITITDYATRTINVYDVTGVKEVRFYLEAV